ncbi:hypothetical protein [Bdellovibrio sp. BCCA]|uniref:hypothetical protein n=1 Tax=Bdellovibrio sp. BCCA TaxID=3136281 RepID=UPI0030F32E10
MKQINKKSASRNTSSPFAEFFEELPRGSGETTLATIIPAKFEDFLVVLSLSEDIPKARRAFFILLACVGPTLEEIQMVSKSSLKWTESGNTKSLIVTIGKGANQRTGIVNPVVQDFIWDTLNQLVGKRPLKWTRRTTNSFLDLYFNIEGVKTMSFRESGMRYLVSVKSFDALTAGKLMGMSAEQSLKHAKESDIDTLAARFTY